MKYHNLWLLIFACAIMTSCSQQGGNNGGSKALLQPANGDIGEIVLSLDSAQWEGEVGAAIRKVLEKPIEALPQDEAQFTLRKASPLKINSGLKKTKNLLYVVALDDDSRESNVLKKLISEETIKKLNNDPSKYIVVLRDQFARGQIVVFLFAKNKELLAQKILENAESIRNVFENEETDRLKGKLFASRSKDIELTIAEDHEYSISVPYGYDLAKNVNNFVWIRQLDIDVEKSLFIYEEDYSTQYQLDRISDLRDEITSTYLRDSEKPDIFIKQQKILPMITDTVTVKNKFALKNRGLWQISDFSGGGPFVSYVLVDEKKGKLFYIEGYVYAPGEYKKNYVRELEAILSTFTLPSEQQ